MTLRSTLPSLLLPILLAATTATAQPNLLDDPGLAAATSGTTTSNSAWQASANQPDGAASAATFQDGFGGDPADIGNTVGFWFRSFEGAQAVGDDLAQASLEQVVTNVDGGDYSLTFSARREEFFLAGAWTATLESNGTGGMAQADLLAELAANGNWTPVALNLTGVSPGDDLTVRISMVDGEEAGSNPQSAFVDDFDLILRAGSGPAEIPTTQDWGLLLQALAVGGLAWWTLRP